MKKIETSEIWGLTARFLTMEEWQLRESPETEI